MKKRHPFHGPSCLSWKAKTMLLMRMIAFFMLASSLQVAARTYSQEKVSVDFKEVRLTEALKQLEKKTAYRFVFSNLLLSDDLLVTVKARNRDSREVLDLLLANTGMSYRIMSGGLVIITTNSIYADTAKIRGRVTDSKGKPLEKVSVISDRGKGTSTNAEGEYVILAGGKGTLRFSLIGYQELTVDINKQSRIDVTLVETPENLSQVVVVAYGTTTRKALTTAISTVPMDKVSAIASPSINDEMGGRMPGVFVTTPGGGPGVKSQIFIRGGNSGQNPPLFVIDGFIRSQNDYENLNPADIESFSVLKDAEATAMYGAQGGNGIILVNTRKGSLGKTSVNYSFNQIWTRPTVLPEKLDSYNRALAINKVYSSEGLTPPYADSVLQYYRDQSKPFVYPNTDWRKAVMRSYAPEQRHDLSISSGTKTLRYYGSLSYYHQGSILKTDNNYNDRVTYRLNAENTVEKIRLKVLASVDGYVEKNVVPNSTVDGGNGYPGIFSLIQNHSPMTLAYNEFGLPYAGTNGNPAQVLDPQSGYNRSTSRILNTILSFDWEAPFLKGLHLRASGNYNMWNTMGKAWSATAPAYNLGSTTPIYGNPPSLTSINGSGATTILQGFVTYHTAFGPHTLDFTGGYEQNKSNNDTVSAQRVNYQILFDQFIAGPTVNMVANGKEARSAYAGYVGRLQYSYASRYFLEGSMRYDGSYLFPPRKRWGFFYGLSGGWVLTEEKFAHPLVEEGIFDFLKLRASYGQVGTTKDVPPYSYLPTYSINPNAWVVGGAPQIGLREGVLPSTSYSWYTHYSTNIGGDFSTLHHKLNGSFEYFYVRTKGYVVPDTSYAVTLGQNLPVINSNAALRKAGYEFNVNWRDKVGGLSYQAGFNFSYYNQLWEIYPGENSVDMSNPYTRYSGTTDSYLTTGYLFGGYYPNNAALLNGAHIQGASNVAGGDLSYVDANGDGQINSADNRRIGNNSFPHVNYGFTLNLAYKGIYLDAVLMGSGSRSLYMGDVIRGSSAQGILVYGFQTNYWTPNNQGAPYPRQLSNPGDNGGNNNFVSGFWLLDARYIRLKSLQIGYDLKTLAGLKNTPFSQLKVFATARNLFTISKSMKYFIDPESDPNNYGYPVQRTFAVGCNIGF